ncbi:MAG: hypothetical protein HY868_04980 [Chloroflexi bacterium]|nr:hypothetical protein [Chloroflexota bacterium]
MSKLAKILVPLFVLVALFVFALPVLADQPGNNEDPFGGFPIMVTIPGDEAMIARLGLIGPLPGGLPSRNSGDGTSPRRAINIGGIWGGQPFVAGEMPPELQNCSLVRIPAGAYRWFKLESYGDRRTRIWLDDELNSATRPSGKAVFGAADRYMLGTAPGDVWQTNSLSGRGDQSENFLEGFVMAVYDPTNLQPNWAYQPPNAALLSVSVDARGTLLRGFDNLSVKDVTGAGIHGYGSYNGYQPNHLLWYEGQWAGWVYTSIYNQMIWDGTATVCSQRMP